MSRIDDGETSATCFCLRIMAERMEARSDKRHDPKVIAKMPARPLRTEPHRTTRSRRISARQSSSGRLASACEHQVSRVASCPLSTARAHRPRYSQERRLLGHVISSHAGWITLTSMEWDTPSRMDRLEFNSMTILPWSWPPTKRASSPLRSCLQWASALISMILSPNSHIDHIRPRSKDDFDTPRDSLRADVEPSDKKLRDRKFLLNHFEAYMEGKLHAGEKYCEKDTTLNTGMSYLAQYWRMKQLIVFRISSGVLQVSSLEGGGYTCPSLTERVISSQLNYHDHSKLILSDEGLTITYIDNAYSIWTWHLASLIQYETSSEEGSRERRRMESAWRKLTYAR